MAPNNQSHIQVKPQEKRVREHDFQRALELAKPKPYVEGGSNSISYSSDSYPIASCGPQQTTSNNNLRTTSSNQPRLVTVTSSNDTSPFTSHPAQSPSSPFTNQHTVQTSSSPFVTQPAQSPSTEDRPPQDRPSPQVEQTVRASAPAPAVAPAPASDYMPIQPNFSASADYRPAQQIFSPSAPIVSNDPKERLRSVLQHPFSLVSAMRKSDMVPAQVRASSPSPVCCRAATNHSWCSGRNSSGRCGRT